MAADCSPGTGPAKPSTGGWFGQELPLRYVCHLCGICIATSEGYLETRDDGVVFGRLHYEDTSDKGSKTLLCPGCDQALGTRGDGIFLMRKERVVKRVERLEILVCSLKQQEITELFPVLQEAFPHSNISTRLLLKAELRGYQLTGLRPAPDFVVIVHRNEGRVLLTDRNGFYHDVLGSAWQQTRGNVLVILTRTETKADAELYDSQLLRSLSTQGDQPTIGTFGALGRVLTWQTAPSDLQLRQLHTLARRAYLRESAITVQGTQDDERLAEATTAAETSGFLLVQPAVMLREPDAMRWVSHWEVVSGSRLRDEEQMRSCEGAPFQLKETHP